MTENNTKPVRLSALELERLGELNNDLETWAGLVGYLSHTPPDGYILDTHLPIYFSPRVHRLPRYLRNGVSQVSVADIRAARAKIQSARDQYVAALESGQTHEAAKIWAAWSGSGQTPGRRSASF